MTTKNTGDTHNTKRKAPYTAYLRSVLFFFVSTVWLELIYRAFYTEKFFGKGLFYILIFSLPLSFCFALLASLWRKRGNRIASVVLISAVSLWFMIQAVYRTIFRTVLVLGSFAMAEQAVGNYWREMFVGIWKTLIVLILMALPLLCCIFFRRLTAPRRVNKRAAVLMIALAVTLQLLAELCTFLPSKGLMSIREIYRQTFDPVMTTETFGVLTTLRLDMTQMLFGLEEEPVNRPVDTVPTPSASPDAGTNVSPGADPDASADVSPSPTPVVYEPNVMDIDFDTLIANETNGTLKDMHIYFQSREATMKNEYTGKFAGKNLIFLTAEGFWKYAVNEKYTPTLYKLANEGFVFTNFYNPLGTHSTIDGEFAACTGLLPSNQMFAFYESVGKSMYFCMGNQLRELGYPTTAYHNHTYDYYRRDESHPNMGYDYYGLGNGLDVKKSWPESDLEMMEKTIPQALAGETPFHLYYMTVSGHMNYNFMGNSMANKHRNDVSDLDMSEEARAYIACNMELDQALAYILEQLEAAGELENTVICLSGDHYPYGMQESTWNELAGHTVDQDFELAQSTLILWSGDMEEPVVVDKLCSSIDILPTLLNLFGLEYDSRLLMGQDIFSDTPGVVELYNKSFITDLGRYNAKTNEFTPNEGATVPDGYAAEVLSQVKQMFTYSDKILTNDYYRKLGLVH